MSHWVPTLAELVAPFAKPRPLDIALERYGHGIDNAHIDVFLSPALGERLRETVRKLIREEVRAQNRSLPRRILDARDLKAFHDSYLGMFASISEQNQATVSADRLVLLQVSLLKCLIQVVARENANLQRELKSAANEEVARLSGRDLNQHESLVALTRDEQAINRRVLRFLFQQLRKLEGGQLQKMRATLVGKTWPFPKRAFFNPVLMIPDLDAVKGLVLDYPIAKLGEGGETDWLFQTNQCVTTVFQHYLPAWTRMSSQPGPANAAVGVATRERLDQGLLRGFLGTEMLLSRFVPAEEYQSGRSSWLDEPKNLRLFLSSGREQCDAENIVVESGFGDSRASSVRRSGSGSQAYWSHASWPDFQNAIVDELCRCIDLNGLASRIILLYWLPAIGNRLGRPVPLSLVLDFIDGRLSRRRLAQRLEAIPIRLEAASVARVLERAAAQLRSLRPDERTKYLGRYLVDFLVLRRDLKLAYKTYEAMDRIRLLDEPGDIQLSRANASLHEFAGGEQRRASESRIRGHAVIKADVRGSTKITERLRDKGLNPASHFGLNFFDPVNRLLSDFGAEKLFVEGDAVILGLFQLEEEQAPTAVARACGLAREILQVVALQNIINRKHGLPDLELGLGISYSSREPNFLYDEGRRIMISGAINRADRLSGCASALRTGRFRPEDKAFRVAVVRDNSAGSSAGSRDVLLGYNVNGIKLEKAAFFKLQKELRLRQVRLPEEHMADSLFFVGRFPDLLGREHWLVLRYGAMREWDGQSSDDKAAERGHFFELIVDEALATRVRKLAEGDEGVPLRGRG